MNIDALYHDVDKAISKGIPQYSLMDSEKMQCYFDKLIKNPHHNGYVTFHNRYDFLTMNCHVTSVTSGILNLNYIIKVTKNDTMFHVYEYVPSPIKITSPTMKNHYVNIISHNSHLMIDPLSRFAKDVNKSFFDKCVNSKDS